MYPIHRIPTAMVLNLQDPKYEMKDPQRNKLRALDYLIRNADNDSWVSGSGGGTSTTLVTCFRMPGGGSEAARHPASRDAGLVAQAQTRRGEGTNVEQNTVLACLAATPTSSCSGWTQKFNENHRTHPIPDHVDEHLLAKLFAGHAARAETAVLPRVIRKRAAKSAIILVMQSAGFISLPISRFEKLSSSTTIRVIITPCRRTKDSLVEKETYREYVEARGCIGATVAKVEGAFEFICFCITNLAAQVFRLTPSAQLILRGKSLTSVAPALHNKRARRNIVREVKNERFPNGLSVTGAFDLYYNGLTKPLPERYIHSYLTTPDGGIRILTCVPLLLKLLDGPGVDAFDGDTTFKRFEGELNEWELTVFLKVVLRAASLVRVYADFFELLFDELQRVKLFYPEKPILRQFVPGGNLRVLNTEMDGAQAIGITRSVMKHNGPEYSKIPTALLLNRSRPTSSKFIVHRMTRNAQRHSAFAQKVRQSQELTDVSGHLKAQIKEEAKKQRQSSALTKGLKEQLKSVKGSSGGRSKKGKSFGPSIIISASSSGRVKTATARRSAKYQTSLR
ncbi:hypothetical protein FB451DRAFT_1180793 [Mycena latifolia]|nr:hypothetical protein FB451DRAFT_1180793 [Mycena latifolia]